MAKKKNTKVVDDFEGSVEPLEENVVNNIESTEENTEVQSLETEETPCADEDLEKVDEAENSINEIYVDREDVEKNEEAEHIFDGNKFIAPEERIYEKKVSASPKEAIKAVFYKPKH